MEKIGFIGLGIMGSRMAMNLQKAGYDLVIYNRTYEKAQSLVENGATWASTPGEVAGKVNVLITMLSTPGVVQEMTLGEQGFLHSLSKGSLWVNCSTVNPSFSRETEILSRPHHVRYLDAPVVGTKGPAEAGELLFLVGGAERDKKEVDVLFDSMGKKTLHLGAVGQAAAMKMLINQLLAQSVAAFAEALVMGEAMGLDQATLFDVLTATPVVAPVINALGPKLKKGDYEANFPLKWIQKDLHLSSISAYECGVAAPSLNAAKELYAQAKQQGYGDKDFSALYAFLNHRE